MNRAQQEKRLRALLPIWQERLGLRDWDIDVSVVPRHKMGDMDHMGHIEMNARKRMAFVSVLDENELGEDEVRPNRRNQEGTLVHELVHLHFLPLENVRVGSKAHEIAEEQAVHALSLALVALAQKKTVTKRNKK